MFVAHRVTCQHHTRHAHARQPPQPRLRLACCSAALPTTASRDCRLHTRLTEHQRVIAHPLVEVANLQRRAQFGVT